MELTQTSYADIISSIVIKGDLSNLSNEQKFIYYKGFCERLGLDPFTQPFKIMKLDGKEVLYCDRSGAQQLNKKYYISHEIKGRELMANAGIYQVIARASTPDGRFQESIGAVCIIYPDQVKAWNNQLNRYDYKPHPKAGQMLKGDEYANAIMKAETKAKRRSTLDLLGLGILDETEAQTLPEAESSDLIYTDNPELSELNSKYMVLYNQYVAKSKDKKAEKFLPDHWPAEQRTIENFKNAIIKMENRLKEIKEKNS